MPTPALPALPDDRRVTLVIPALDEVAAVGDLAELQVQVTGVVDRMVVLDGGSTDGTPEAARAKGLEVVAAADLPPGSPVLGKGDSIWRAADLEADVLVFRDADVTGVEADAIAELAAAAARPGVALAKGRFERLQYEDGPPRPTSGRITEFVARPLLALLAREVAGLDEPLSGQFAIRREVLRELEVVTRFGVDVGLVLDVVARHGPEAVVQVDIGALTHHSKADRSLVPMAHDVAATILGRLGHTAPLPPADGDPMTAGRLASAGPLGPLVVRPPRADIRRPGTGQGPTGDRSSDGEPVAPVVASERR